MKVESTKYYCDVCRKEVDSDRYLSNVRIPIRYFQESSFQGLGQFLEKPYRHDFEICDECLKALRKVITEHFADMYAQSYTNEIVVELKYKKGNENE